jgi:CIC family chloride channel protein
VFAAIVAAAKRFSAGPRPWARRVLAGCLAGACFLVGRGISGTNLTLGPGYDFVHWAIDPHRGLPLLIAAATLRVVATSCALGGGAAGGLFIPLVLQGALVGRIVGGAFGSDNPTLLPMVGIAAFLGAGYHVPLAAVVFVAEVTGRPGYIVPGLIAAVVAQLVVGTSSVTTYQVAARSPADPVRPSAAEQDEPPT